MYVRLVDWACDNVCCFCSGLVMIKPAWKSQNNVYLECLLILGFGKISMTGYYFARFSNFVPRCYMTNVEVDVSHTSEQEALDDHPPLLPACAIPVVHLRDCPDASPFPLHESASHSTDFEELPVWSSFFPDALGQIPFLFVLLWQSVCDVGLVWGWATYYSGHPCPPCWIIWCVRISGSCHWIIFLHYLVPSLHCTVLFWWKWICVTIISTV